MLPAATDTNCLHLLWCSIKRWISFWRMPFNIDSLSVATLESSDISCFTSGVQYRQTPWPKVEIMLWTSNNRNISLSKTSISLYRTFSMCWGKVNKCIECCRELVQDNNPAKGQNRTARDSINSSCLRRNHFKVLEPWTYSVDHGTNKSSKKKGWISHWQSPPWHFLSTLLMLQRQTANLPRFSTCWSFNMRSKRGFKSLFLKIQISKPIPMLLSN